MLALILIFHTAHAFDDRSLLGAWRLDDGRVFTLAPSAKNSWRFRFMQDGRSGRLHRRDEDWVAGPGFADLEPISLRAHTVSADRLDWSEVGAAMQAATRVPVREVAIDFTSGHTHLVGHLVLPDGTGPYPLVVLIHGSERLAAVGQWHDPYMLAAHGIAAFVYDKRGTGRSGGDFTANFALLADDAVAAARILVQRAEVDEQRVGFMGYSQGGWVAPLAAERFGQARAVLVAYGTVGSPAQEDRWQCHEALDRLTDDQAVHARLDQLIDATHAVLLDDLRGDWSAFKRSARLWKASGWSRQLRGDACIAASFVRYPIWVLRLFARKRLPPGLDWTYDSTALLQRSTVPMLWLLAEQDREAPTALTAASLHTLVQAGRPISVQILKDADHGMLLFREQAGVRTSTGYHPGYMSRILEFWAEQF